MKVNVHISDLFFNTQHDYQRKTDSKKLLDRKQFREGFSATIHTEAGQFLDSLESLGVDVPSVEDLIEDFFARL